MQYLVVLTSRSGPLEKEPGWILNGVKRKVSHKFGYGLMDAGAMVNLAKQWTNVPPQHICKSQEINEERPIDPTFGYTLNVYMDVSGCAGTLNEVRFLEHVQCKVSYLAFFSSLLQFGFFKVFSFFSEGENEGFVFSVVKEFSAYRCNSGK